MNKEMSSTELREEIIEFLNEHREGSMATCRDNIPRTSPVQYFLGSDLDIYVVSAGGEKFDAISKNQNVCLLVNTEYVDYKKIKGVQVFGQATTSLMDGGLIREAKRYMFDPYILDKGEEGLKVIKIVPTEIVYLNSLVHGDRTKQILRENELVITEDREYHNEQYVLQ